MAASGKKTGKGSKKIGRHVNTCKVYRLAGRRERNKTLKILRHIKKYPNDLSAKKALNNIQPRNHGRT